MAIKPLRFLLIVPALVLLLVVGCSSSSDEPKFSEIVVVERGKPIAQALADEIIVGENRFIFYVLSADEIPVVDARTRITFYDLNEGEEKKETYDAVSVVPARDAGLTEQIVHIHADGSRHIHVNAGEQIGLYSVSVNFDRSGLWGAEVDIDGGSPPLTEKLLLRFNVIEQGTVPNIGDDAPPSENLTAADVEDLSIIDTSSEPSAEMHEMTIAEGIESGNPTLVLFAAPGYCQSFICGPEYEIMKKLYGEYQGRPVNFIHVEFYQDAARGNRNPVAAAQEWNLRTEPWFFLIDGDGKIAARFEGPTSLFELREALRKIGH